MTIYKLFHYLVAAVWLVNGLFCKLMNGVPRHQEIVARILGNSHAAPMTRMIGLAEISMAVWIASGYWARLNAITQVAIIATMNVLEFILAPDLLMWGRFNLLFAFLFMLLILYNEYFLKPALIHQP